MRLALAQMNPYIGDLSGNTDKICRFIERAKEEECDLVIFPELALTGYPPRDLLDKPGFIRDSQSYWPQIREASKGIGVICGVVDTNKSALGKPLHNAAVFFSDGSLLACAHKWLLPSYDVFDEDRYFEPAKKVTWVDFKGKRLGLTICEDVWNVADFLPHFPYPYDPLRELEKVSAQIVINISASPYHMGKSAWVTQLLQTHAKRACAQVVHVNQVGGNDELIFQGHSMVFDESGHLTASGADFREDLVIYDTETRKGDFRTNESDLTSELIEALVLGLRDYVQKCHFEKAVLGLSGGIDSAVTACLATLALGADKVLGVAMPGPYNAPESLADAQDLANRLGISFTTVPISDLFSTALQTLGPVFADTSPDVTEENIQARLRGLILMALSNKFCHLLLSTGNKSELAVGYSTLYGDMNGGLAVLGDVPKTIIYPIAQRLSQQYNWIPERTISRPPSAELRPNQKDQDSLPPYEVLDAILSEYVEKRKPAEEIIAKGWDSQLVHWVINRVDRNEYKRWQAPPVLRVTTKAFGSGRRFPIAHGYREKKDD